ncbi:MAG TPA: hypothetical protein VJM32_02455 [Candidatus Saccharimonadales bacterium]|nr:hypothetical protein [Candidatus Saccharimonadales bacterium]
MASQRMVRGITLRKLLLINPSTLRHWGITYQCLVPSAHVATEPLYSHQAVNQFLAAGARNFATAPTIEDLLSGRIQLIRPAHAAKLIGHPKDSLHTVISRGHLEAIKLRAEHRIVLASALAYIDAEEDESRVPRLLAEKIIGGSRWTLDNLVKTGRLTEATHPHNPHWRPITRDSLLELLGALLPSWIAPDDWFEDRIAHGGRLLSTKDAAQRVGGKRLLQSLFSSQELQFIRSPGGLRILVAPESIEAYLEQTVPLSTAQLARVFAVSDTAIGQWRQAGVLTCPVHSHSTPELTMPCVLAILKTRLSPGASARRWYNGRLYGSSTLVSRQEAATLLEISPHEVARQAMTGDIRGLRMSDVRPRWVFSRRHIMHVRQERKR